MVSMASALNQDGSVRGTIFDTQSLCAVIAAAAQRGGPAARSDRF
jgi:hypothetical protein